MPQRKSLLLPLLLALVVVGLLLFLTWRWFLIPWNEYGVQLADLDAKIEEKIKQIIQVRKERAALDRFEAMSLPTNVDYAQQEYDRYLVNLIDQHGFKLNAGLRYIGSTVSTGTGPKSVFGASKKADPVYTALLYKLDAQASLGHLASMLREFDEVPLMHRIRSLSVKPIDSEAKKDSKKDPKKKDSFLVSVQMDIEAVIVEGANSRPQTLIGPDERLVEINALTLLARGPGGIALVPWMIGPVGPLAKAKAAKAKGYHDYSRIERDNIFIGYQKKESLPAPPSGGKVLTPTPTESPYDMREFYKLILISKTPERDEAWLYSPLKDHKIRLRTSPGFNTFAVTDLEGEKTLLKGKVLKIDYGMVYFQVDNRVYCIQRGENLKEATKTSIPDTELIKVGLKIVKGS